MATRAPNFESKTASPAPPSSPAKRAGTAPTTASPAAPLSLRATTNPGLARTARERPSSPVASPLTTPPLHLNAFAGIWATMSADTRRRMASTSFADIERSIEDVKSESDKQATLLAAEEHRARHGEHEARHDAVLAAITVIEASVLTAQATLADCLKRLPLLRLEERKTADAVTASLKEHAHFTRGFRNPPLEPDAPPPTARNMGPPLARHPAPAEQRAHIPESLPAPYRPDPPTAWSEVASRQPPRQDNSYMDVRLSALRHHNMDFPLATRNAIFHMATSIVATFEGTGRPKATLRSALAFASPPSTLPLHIALEIPDLCQLVQEMYEARLSPAWFQRAITSTREARDRTRRARTDSSASDRSTESRRPRHREDPASGRGKSKRVMTALTTDSDTGPDSPPASDRDKRHFRKKIALGADGPGAFQALLTDVADHFDGAPRGAALASLQTFGVPSGTPFSSYLRSFRVVVASTVAKGGPLAPSSEMAIELIRIRTAQQYPMLMPTLFPGSIATQE